jgi:hypothetical protein
MIRPSAGLIAVAAALAWIVVAALAAQQAPASSPYSDGNRLGLPIIPNPAEHIILPLIA